ncbi:unnamed protein product [Lactuca virosa]|uniref:Uncharacterized protein n=1 Tax=Lactuca virosa TaxID=75947 RepID=A0AAU9PWX0_9ASTR|nr:unnamed protein product [Lactuca virosa]
MASYLPHPSTTLTISYKKSGFRPSNLPTTLLFIENNQINSISKPYLTYKTSSHLNFLLNPCCTATKSSTSSSTTNVFLEKLEKDDNLPVVEDSPVKFLFWALLWASFLVALYAFSPADAKAQEAHAAVQSIKASSFGLKFANFLRGYIFVPSPAINLTVQEQKMNSSPIFHYAQILRIASASLSIFIFTNIQGM